MRIKSPLFALAIGISVPGFAASTPGWVQRSNQNADTLLNVMVKYSPESASRLGLEGHDKEVTTLPLDVNVRTKADLESARHKLEAKLAGEKDPAVLQDLQILTNSVDLRLEGIRLGEKYNLPYFDVPLTVFQ